MIRKFHIPFTIPSEDVVKELYRELQVHRIISIQINDGIAIVEIDNCEQYSLIMKTTRVSNFDIIFVNHHSALLQIWLSLKMHDRKITLIHVDSHNDLGSPNVIRRDNQLIDRWTGNFVNPAEIPTIIQAIQSAAIEIGSYLTMALFLLPVSHLIWLCPEKSPGIVRGMENPCGLRLDWSHSDTLDSNIKRLNALPIIDNSFKIEFNVIKNPSKLREFLLKESDTVFLLDIDCDYFDNSDENAIFNKRNQENEIELNEWTKKQRGKIRDILDAIPHERLINIGVAYSPGFCPADKASILDKLIIDILTE
jgi:frataxin-like iron-binding protein CyaY